jgi:predicted nuclease of predicted toxin-antitoxin system
VKLFLDSSIGRGVCDAFKALEYDILWAGDWAEHAGDQKILNAAFQDNRILITLDKDFGELVVVHEQPHGGIIRLVNWSIRRQPAICFTLLDRYAVDLLTGAIVTAEPGRIRIRPPVLEPDSP